MQRCEDGTPLPSIAHKTLVFLYSTLSVQVLYPLHEISISVERTSWEWVRNLLVKTEFVCTGYVSSSSVSDDFAKALSDKLGFVISR